MYCKECGAEIMSGARFCSTCGKSVSTGASPNSDKPNKRKGSRATVFVLVIVVVAAYLFFVYDHTASDIKNIVFDQYGSETLGSAADDNLSNVKWQSTKIDKDYYNVTLRGFLPEISSQITVDFDVSYADDYIYATPVRVSFGGDTYSDTTAISFIMAMIYGNDDLASTMLLWSMIN